MIAAYNEAERTVSEVMDQRNTLREELKSLVAHIEDSPELKVSFARQIRNAKAAIKGNK